MSDCHECFHPKLFYYICAATDYAFGLTTNSSQIIAGQLLNSAAGMLTLLLVFSQLHRSPLAFKWRLWAITLIALNPRLIAINGQLSNDSFAILFGTGAVFLTIKCLTAPSICWCIAAQLVLSWGLMTKGTTWVIGIAMLIVFVVRSMREPSKKDSLVFLGMYLVTAVNGYVSILSAGYDFEHYDVYANRGRGHPLHFLEPTDVGRPGVRSIADGYLTFRFVSLLRDPQITNGKAIEQTHRTSVWTQLYARAHFAQFEQHPPSWKTDNPLVLNIARCSMVLGLLPLFFLCVGLAESIFNSLRAWRSGFVPMRDNYLGFFCTITCLGYIAFIIKFTADYRDFAAIKLIYLLPGVLPFAIALLKGMQLCGERLPRRSVESFLNGALFILAVSYFAGIVSLVLLLSTLG